MMWGQTTDIQRCESVLVQRNLYCTRPAVAPAAWATLMKNRSGPWAPVLGEFEDLSNKLLLVLLR